MEKKATKNCYSIKNKVQVGIVFVVMVSLLILTALGTRPKRGKKKTEINLTSSMLIQNISKSQAE